MALGEGGEEVGLFGGDVLGPGFVAGETGGEVVVALGVGHGDWWGGFGVGGMGFEELVWRTKDGSGSGAVVEKEGRSYSCSHRPRPGSCGSV